MAFSLNNIKGVADGLLNDASQEIRNEARRTQFIPFSKLIPSALNKDLSKDGIDELADQIYHDGLDQPLVVYPTKNDQYEVLGGERRLLAIGKLISDGRYEQDHMVECKVKHFDDSKLPLTLEEHKIFTWLTTNQYREKTDSDKYIEVVRWKEIIKKLKKNGIKVLVTGYDENGEPIKKEIKGNRTRSLVSEQTNMSASQVGKIERIDSSGSEKLKAALKKNKINITGADRLTALSKKEQDDFIEKTLKAKDSTITASEIDKVLKKAKAQKHPKVKVSNSAIKKDIDRIMKELETFNRKEVDQQEYDDYKKSIKIILDFLKE